MKLRAYARARQAGVSSKTAWRWWHAGHLDAYQAASGTVIVREAARGCYEQRRAKRKTETIVKELTGQDAAVAEAPEVAEDATR